MFCSLITMFFCTLGIRTLIERIAITTKYLPSVIKTEACNVSRQDRDSSECNLNPEIIQNICKVLGTLKDDLSARERHNATTVVCMEQSFCTPSHRFASNACSPQIHVRSDRKVDNDKPNIAYANTAFSVIANADRKAKKHS